MTKYNIPYFSIRLLTILAYFLPFVFFLSTCTGHLNSKQAYNQEDAIINENIKLKNKIDKITSVLESYDTAYTNRESINSEILETINREFNTTDNITNVNSQFLERFFSPTNYSLSAIGAIVFYKNMLGRIFLGISLFISLLTFLFWIFINKKRWGIYFIAVNLITVCVFAVECYFSGVTLLIGGWVLVFLLLVQLLTEFQNRNSLDK